MLRSQQNLENLDEERDITNYSNAMNVVGAFWKRLETNGTMFPAMLKSREESTSSAMSDWIVLVEHRQCGFAGGDPPIILHVLGVVCMIRVKIG